MRVFVGGKTEWQDAQVKSFGHQSLLRVYLERYGVKKTVRATPDHIWFVNKSARNRKAEVRTDDLRPGDLLSVVHPRPRLEVGPYGVKPSPIGIMHGFTFCDGCRNRRGSLVTLYAKKDLPLLPFFAAHKFNKKPDSRGFLTIGNLPGFFKSTPSLEESRAYLYGWLAGYFAADGHITKDGSVRLWSANRRNMQFARDVCTVLGLTTYGIYRSLRTGYGTKPTAMFYIGISHQGLTKEFFILNDHRKRFASQKDKFRRSGWKVKSVRNLQEREEVFCAVVPKAKRFALEDYIMVHNCNRISFLVEPHTPDMTVEDCHEFFNQARALNWYPAVILIGGEPTMHKDLDEICRLSRVFADEGVARGLSVKPELAGLVQIWSNQTDPVAREKQEAMKRKYNVSVVYETAKPDGSQVLSTNDIYVSPLDLGLGVRPHCWQHASVICGISVDHDGYTPCATGGAVDGILKIGFKTKRLADLFDEQKVAEITERMCSPCGNDLSKTGMPGVTPEEWREKVKSMPKWKGMYVSPTWEKAFKGRKIGPS